MIERVSEATRESVALYQRDERHRFRHSGVGSRDSACELRPAMLDPGMTASNDCPPCWFGPSDRCSFSASHWKPRRVRYSSGYSSCPRTGRPALILPLVAHRTLVPPSDRHLRRVVRIFAIAAVFRFIVPIFVGGSFLVSEALLQPALDTEGGALIETEEEISGGAEGLLERLRETAERTRDVIRARANDLLERIARVLAAVFVKNILSPILFLFVAMKCGGYVVRRATNLKLGSPANMS